MNSPRFTGGRRSFAALALGLLATACAAPAPNASGVAVRDADTGAALQGVGHIGINTSDYRRVSAQVVADLLEQPFLSNAARPPQVIVDAANFRNASSQRLDVNMFTDRLRVELMRASGGRITFVSRENAGMVEEERSLRRSGRVDMGTRGMTRAQAGADYRLAGRISSQTDLDPATGMRSRLTQVTFELIDTERGTVAWTKMVDFHRAGADSIVYR